MKRLVIIIVVVMTLFALCAHAKPVPRDVAPQPHDSPNPRVEFPATTANAVVDTTYLLGGPGSWDGKFETPAGEPDWHGWTHEDLSISLENHWHVSTYMADQIPGHGPGNHAMYCGDETIPSCAPNDSIGGYGHGWSEEIEWRQTVDDPGQPVTVRLTGTMNFDTEPGYDFVYLIIQRGETPEVLATWDDQGTAALDFTTVLSPGEFTGSGNNEVRLVWRFRSDGAWDDVDCLFPTRGACQIDDLAVYLDGNLVTLDDFEPGNPVNWDPFELPGVGDFANLRNNLQSVHACQSVNLSFQANFIDDGVVVPGTGGTPCITWCYGPEGWIINNDGGLMNDDDFHQKNLVISPPMAWPAGKDGAELAFDVFVHENFGVPGASGIFPFWWVRSTASSDPADLQDAPWVHRNLGLVNPSGSYVRKIQPVSDLMVPDRQWAQVALGTFEFGFRNGFDGPNGTPAPYYDNVAFKVWDPDGPEILVEPREILGDASPESGILDPVNLAANSCRVDMASVIFGGDRGDSLVVRITPLRHGAAVVDPPSLHWVMKSNPVFDSVRPSAPDAQGILRGMTSGSVALNNNGDPVEGRWAFDLPDTGFFYPGDRLRYYITASDDLTGDVRTAVWPPDTTGILDFSGGSLYPYHAEIRGLPTVTQPVAGQFAHPPMLFVDDSRIDPQVRISWLEALDDLGFQPSENLDILTIHFPSDFSQFMTVDVLTGYQTMLYSAGTSFSSMDMDGPIVVDDWLMTGGKKLLLAGQAVNSTLNLSSQGQILSSRLGVNRHGSSITNLNGAIWDLLVSPVPDNGVLPDDIQWQVNAACPQIRLIDAIGSTGDGQSAATLDAVGSPGGPYSAVITTQDPVLDNRTAVLPFDLDAVSGMTTGSNKRDKVFSPSTYLVYFLMSWLGADVVSGARDIPGAGQVSVTAHPNPFNPSTTIAFELPRAMEVSLDFYDLQGRLVRRLLDESPYVAGSHKQVWDGRDSEGRITSSGVYFYRFEAGHERRVGKLTLLK